MAEVLLVTTETHGDGRLPPAAATLFVPRPCAPPSGSQREGQPSGFCGFAASRLAAPVALDPRGADPARPAPDKGRLEVKSRRCRRRTLQEANSARGPVLPKPLSGADERGAMMEEECGLGKSCARSGQWRLPSRQDPQETPRSPQSPRSSRTTVASACSAGSRRTKSRHRTPAL